MKSSRKIALIQACRIVIVGIHDSIRQILTSLLQLAELVEEAKIWNSIVCEENRAKNTKILGPLPSNPLIARVYSAPDSRHQPRGCISIPRFGRGKLQIYHAMRGG